MLNNKKVKILGHFISSDRSPLNHHAQPKATKDPKCLCFTQQLIATTGALYYIIRIHAGCKPATVNLEPY